MHLVFRYCCWWGWWCWRFLSLYIQFSLVAAPRCTPWLSWLSTHYQDRFICNDSTRVFVIMWPSCTKSNSGINIIAVICIVGDKTDLCFGSLKFPISCQRIKIEPLSVTVNLRGGLWTSQGSPCVTSQWRVSVLLISDKWVQRVSPLVDDYEPELLVNLHTETDLWEGWDPVSR